MSPDQGPPDHARRNARLFGTVAPTYDQLGFLTLAARHLSSAVQTAPHEHILDIATGTGTVALALAGQAGRVTGIDVVPEMIAQARAKAAALREERASFEVADASALPFADATFDQVVCAAGLFFMPDMDAALREWRRVLRPGGTLSFSSFGRGLLGELPGLWRQALAEYGDRPAAPPLGRIPTPQAACKLLRGAGFQDAGAELSVLPYVFETPRQRWAEIVAGLEGAGLRGFSPERRQQIGRAHRQQLETLSWPQAVPVPVILATGQA